MKTAEANLVTDQARAAVVETAGDEYAVGDQVSVESTEDGLMAVRFACTLTGYQGWEWTVDLAVLDGVATVCETALLPGPSALRAPSWVPWSERVRPGDLEPGMVLPYVAEDPRLVPGYTHTDDDDRDELAIFEFGLGRERVLAPEARGDVADRWYRGSHGPSAPSALVTTAVCADCAFYVPLSGSFRIMFGACTNEWSPSDGRVVSVDHGCGAHSQTDAERRLSEWPAVDPIVDSGAIDALDLAAPDPIEYDDMIEQDSLDVEANPERIEEVADADTDEVADDIEDADEVADIAADEAADTDEAAGTDDVAAPEPAPAFDPGIQFVLTIDGAENAPDALVADAWAFASEANPEDEAAAE